MDYETCESKKEAYELGYWEAVKDVMMIFVGLTDSNYNTIIEKVIRVKYEARKAM